MYLLEGIEPKACSPPHKAKARMRTPMGLHIGTYLLTKTNTYLGERRRDDMLIDLPRG